MELCAGPILSPIPCSPSSTCLGWSASRSLDLHGNDQHHSLAKAVGCCQDPVLIEDGPTADVEAPIVHADLPRPLLLRGVHAPYDLPLHVTLATG